MKFVSLISGGKDSVFNTIQCVALGHELVCVANMAPPQQLKVKEMDSFMYQTVGVEIAPKIAECLQVPIIVQQINGKSLNQEMYYENDDSDQGSKDEVEDLYQLLKKVKQEYPEIQAVASGAIFSNYQRLRVENVCSRLGLTSMAYLWRQDQSELLDSMIKNGMDIRLVKVCSMGLNEQHLMQNVVELQPLFEKLNNQFKFNVCGEGGEYESAVLDCCLFKEKKIKVLQHQIVRHTDNEVAPVAYVQFDELEVVDKSEEEKQSSLEKLNDLKNQNKCFEVANDKRMPLYMNENQTTILSLSDHEQLSATQQTEMLFFKLKSLLKDNKLDLKDIVQMRVFLSDMNMFAEVNKAYAAYFTSKPPSRLCISLGGTNQVQLSAIACKRSAQRSCTQVQSFSKWCPPSIGPYSQCQQVNKLLFIAGKIGLNATHMQFPNGLIAQYNQIKDNFKGVFECIVDDIQEWRYSCLYMIAFVCYSHTQNLPELRSMLEKDFKSVPYTIVLVQTLPRDAAIELEVLGHTLEDSDLSFQEFEQFQIKSLLCFDKKTKSVEVLEIIGVLEDIQNDLENTMTKHMNLINQEIMFKINRPDAPLKVTFYIPLNVELVNIEFKIQELLNNQNMIVEKVQTCQQQTQIQYRIESVIV